MNAIEVRNLTKRWSPGSAPVFENLDLIVREGEITYLLGPSGVGKSVLLKHIVGLIRPDQGEIKIFGDPIPYDDSRALNDVRKHFGFLFQGAALFDAMNVLDNVLFPLATHRKDLSPEQRRSRATQMIADVGLDPATVLVKMPNQLSGGMRKRVALARAMVLEPRILLYDEPTTGLDPLTRGTVDELILKTNQDFGLTSLVISHDLPSAFRLADQVAFLHSARVAYHGPPAGLRTVDHPYIQRFLAAEKRHVQEMMA